MTGGGGGGPKDDVEYAFWDSVAFWESQETLEGKKHTCVRSPESLSWTFADGFQLLPYDRDENRITFVAADGVTRFSYAPVKIEESLVKGFASKAKFVLIDDKIKLNGGDKAKAAVDDPTVRVGLSVLSGKMNLAKELVATFALSASLRAPVLRVRWRG